MSWLLIAFAFDLSIWPGRFAACLHFFSSPFKCIRTHTYISYLYFSLTATLDGQCNECSPSLHFISAGHAFGRQCPRKVLRKLHMCVCVSDLNKAHTFQALLVMLLILSSWWRALAQLAIRVPHVGPYGYANMSTSQTLYAAQKFNNTNTKYKYDTHTFKRMHCCWSLNLLCLRTSKWSEVKLLWQRTTNCQHEDKAEATKVHKKHCFISCERVTVKLLPSSHALLHSLTLYFLRCFTIYFVFTMTGSDVRINDRIDNNRPKWLIYEPSITLHAICYAADARTHLHIHFCFFFFWWQQ